ncbi:MAG: hypothetical protein GY722_25430 [bacterium]|nr:hypothetical protein [bacterium]
MKEAMEDLGGKVLEPAPNRDDWIVEFPEEPAVIEVKGKKSSAAESDAAQLEKWVASYFEDNGKHAKGILVVNGWREKPIDSRKKPVFPSQMLKYSESRGHCLMSGLQVLTLQMLVNSGHLGASDARKLILGTNGCLQGHDLWKDVFERIETHESE